jgi:hypothetical protein
MAVLGGCATAQNGQPTPMNQALDRSDTHLVLLWTAADSGHREAAYELCQYYGFVVFDEKKERYWLERAVKLDYVPAIVV